jgi:Flp pilus assembly protein TadG
MLARTAPPKRRESAGQVLILFLVSFFILLLIVGLVIDGGLIYGKRAELSKAVDAASLAGITHLSQGQGQAGQVARDMFAANYRSSSLDAQAPDVNVQFSVDANGTTTIDIGAKAYLQPLFIRIFPEFDVFQVRASAQARRAKLVMSLVLDRSGSMRSNQGCVGLPPAVDTFIDFFDEANDRVSLSTFASNATLDVPLTRPFKNAVRAAVPRDCSRDYGGFTFFDGGLELAGQQNQGAPVQPGEQVIKVVVFFTDGLANTFQDTFPCPSPTVWNMTSGDGGNQVHLLDPQSGVDRCQSTPSDGGPLPCCPGLATFPSIAGGVRTATGPRAGLDVRQEAKDRALARARSIRMAGNTVYTIGLGNNLDQDFLKQIANDPTSPAFDPSQPAGEFAHAPTAAQLQAVFQAIARKILVRLSV